MRIVFLRSNPVDPDSRVEKEVNSLIKAGHEIEVLAWDRSEKYKIKDSYLNLDSGKIMIHRFGIPATYGGGIKKNLLPLIFFQMELYKWLYLNRNKYDAIHACDFDTAYTALKVAKKFNKKLVYDIFDYYVDAFRVPSFLKRIIEKKDHEVINTADATIICSEKRKEQIKDTKPKRLYIIHNTPYKLASQIENQILEKSKIKLVYVGILAGGRFIREIADVVKDNTNYEFHIGGFGKLEDYFKKMAQKYNNIIFYGKLSYKETLQLESSCDIITAIYDPSVPNHYYAAPNKFYEALMLGKPIIMAKNTGMDHIVTQYNIGEVIEYNQESLKDAIENLVKRKHEWKEISFTMKELYEKEYSWCKMEERLISLYQVLKK